MFAVPHPVTNLKLSANAQTINASWEQPDQGGYQEFALTLWEPLVGKVCNKTTTTLSQVFPNLKAGAEYTVEVFVIGVGKLISTSTSEPIYTCEFTIPVRSKLTSKVLCDCSGGYALGMFPF